MKSPIKHCFSKLMHTEPWNKMRGTTAEVHDRDWETMFYR